MKEYFFNLADHSHFKAFYLRNYDAIVGFVQSYLKDHEASEDVVQESFFKLYRQRERFRGEEDARAWLYVTARNMSFDQLRHRKFSPEEIKDIYTSDDFFLDEITRQEGLLVLRSSIDALPPQTKKVVLLSCDGMSNPEIADALGLSINSVKTLKKEAYKKLRNLLDNPYFYLLLYTILR